MKNIKIVVDIDISNHRIDKYLVEHTNDFSRSHLQKFFAKGNITIQNIPVKPSYKLKGGEEININYYLEIPQQAKPENIPLEIIYEDHSVLVVNKPAGMVVHPATGHWTGTLVNALMYHCEKLSDSVGENRPGIVHRLDKDTSGLIITAKNNSSHAHLTKQLQERSMEKNMLRLW